MVKSLLNDSINYKENRKLEKLDMTDHEAPLYEIEMYGVTLRIATGKINKAHEKYGVYYLPIYIIFRKKVKLQIGLYELEKDVMDDLTDEDGDIQIDQLTPLLYSYVTSKPGILKPFRIEEEGEGGEEEGEGGEEDEEGDEQKDGDEEAHIEESKDK